MKRHNTKGISRRSVDYLLSEFSARSIECALVKLFLEKHKMDNINNSFLQGLVEEFDESSELKRYINKMSVHLDLKTIERIFELLIPGEDRKLNGVFYTPDFMANYIIDRAVRKDSLVCDPSCGSGAFLVAAAEKMHQLRGGKITDIIESNLFGCDILDYSVERSKIILSLLALSKGENPEEIKFNLVNDDSLNMDWRRAFPEVVKHEEWESVFNISTPDSGFDAIIGNPPHVRVQDLKDDVREELTRRWNVINHGSFNIYFAFFELGMKLLKHDGILGYVVPNNFFTSLAARKLREWMQSNRTIKEIVDFNHLQLFQDAITYTCIVILRNAPQESFGYKRVDRMEDIQQLDDIPLSGIRFDDIKPKKWRLMNRDDFINVQRIEDAGTPLGELARIKVGIATLKDKLYFVDGASGRGDFFVNQHNGEYLIEKEITRDIVKISSVVSEEDIKRNTRKIIFPYRKLSQGMELIPEHELKSEYPECYSYLLAIKDELRTRDKGKKKYSAWYAYGRGHGIDLVGPKILTPTFSKKPRFMIDWSKSSLFCNGYGVFHNGEMLELETLKRVLNSVIMEYYITKTSVHLEGGFPCFQKNFIELFSIPSLTQAEREFLCSAESTKQIDQFLIGKYGLDEEVVKRALEQRP